MGAPQEGKKAETESCPLQLAPSLHGPRASFMQLRVQAREGMAVDTLNSTQTRSLLGQQGVSMCVRACVCACVYQKGERRPKEPIISIGLSPRG